MRNLYLRFFLSFWSAMLLVLTFTIFGVNWIDSEHYEKQRERQDELARQASGVLAGGGVDALRSWLVDELPMIFPDRMYVLDEHSHDLLDRSVPEPVLVSLGKRPYPNAPNAAAGKNQRGPDYMLLSQLVGANNDRYALSFIRDRGGRFGFLKTISAVALIGTLLAATFVCFLLARFLSAPIQHLRAATRSIASGNLSVHVKGAVGKRRDELAMLAVDFDAMAARLRTLLEARQQLLRDVSHELRSPLARLQIALGLARRPGANLTQEFDRIEQEAQRLDEMIGEILSLSRLDDPTPQVATESVSIEELLEVVCENARVEGDARGIRVALEAAEGMQVIGDRELLYRAVENVVRNAVRYSPSLGLVTVKASLSGQAVLIRVQDQGPGVPVALLQRIFEPFFRVSDARDRDSGGNGIGLAITARVVALQGGTVQAANDPDGGLIMEIRLPLVRPSEAALGDARA
jgi:two-component system sensor histidine kinase CpxA